MAQRRMFNKLVTNDDNFLDMPDSSQNLYFHLSMNADDDGFVNNWKSIMRMTGHKEDDLKVLIAKQYIIPFESGVIVIRHWRLNNYLQNDRITKTNYQKEYKMLSLNDNVYNMDTQCIQNVSTDKIRLDKNRLDKISIEYNIVEENPDNDIYKQVIEYLNQRTNSYYKDTTRKTKDLIKARINEGFTLEDFKKVIDNKTSDWLNTDMEKYLRPETLFGTKFESYLQQKTKLTGTKEIQDKIDWSDWNE